MSSTIASPDPGEQMSSTIATRDPGEQLLLQQFNDLEQQNLTSNLGMWFFLASEVMFFSGLLASYMIYRMWSPEAFHLASRHMDKWVGLANTGVLLTSSLTMALAVRCTQVGDLRGAYRNLVFTALLGLGFLGVKAYEYQVEISHNLFPGENFIVPGSPEDPHAAEAGAEGHASDYERLREASMVDGQLDEELFSRNLGHFQLMFVFYFFVTGIHAFHMIIGIVIIGIFAVLMKRRWFSGYGQTQTESLGLYWHFVDLVWVFVYPLLYLVE